MKSTQLFVLILMFFHQPSALFGCDPGPSPSPDSSWLGTNLSRSDALTGIAAANAVYEPRPSERTFTADELANGFLNELETQLVSSGLISKTEFQARLRPEGHPPRCRVFENSITKTRMVLFADPIHPKRLCVSFRGTSNLENVVIDVALLDPAQTRTGRHHGFDGLVQYYFNKTDAFRKLPETVTSILGPDIRIEDPEFRLAFMGHSMGAAAAIIASTDFFLRNWNPRNGPAGYGWGIAPERVHVVAVSSPKPWISLEHPIFAAPAEERASVVTGTSPEVLYRCDRSTAALLSERVARHTVLFQHDGDLVPLTPPTDLSKIHSSHSAATFAHHHPEAQLVFLRPPISNSLLSNGWCMLRGALTGKISTAAQQIHSGSAVLESALNERYSRTMSGAEWNAECADIELRATQGTIAWLGRTVAPWLGPRVDGLCSLRFGLTVRPFETLAELARSPRDIVPRAVDLAGLTADSLHSPIPPAGALDSASLQRAQDDLAAQTAAQSARARFMQAVASECRRRGAASTTEETASNSVASPRK